jgi:hypothetical protein
MRRPYRVVGAILLIAGFAGFWQNPVFGVFEVNLLHNVVHLASGALTLLAANRGIGAMRRWGKAFGAFYLLVAIAGFALADGNVMGVLHLNQPDNALHLGLAAFFLYCGLLAPPRL